MLLTSYLNKSIFFSSFTVSANSFTHQNPAQHFFSTRYFRDYTMLREPIQFLHAVCIRYCFAVLSERI